METDERTGTTVVNAAGGEAPVTVKQWLLFWAVSLVNVIPIIGSIAYVIFVLYVAFGNNPKFPVSMQNFCKAYFVVIAIMIVLVLIFAGSFLGMLAGLGAGY